MRLFLSLTILAVTSLIIFWQPNSTVLFWQDSIAESNILPTEPKNTTITSNNIDHQALSKNHEIQYNDRRDNTHDEITENFIPNPEAVASMQKARFEGDSRAPKLGEHHERETPTEAELGDHEQYLEYERRQQKRIYRAYVDASKIKTAQLRSMIEQGKTEGVSAAEIEFAEEKIRGIEEMAITLQQDFPEIMDDSYQPPADWLIENLGKDDNSIKSDQTKANIAQ